MRIEFQFEYIETRMWECAATAGNVYHTRFNDPPPSTSPPPAPLSPVSRSRQTFDWYVQQLCTKKNIKNSIQVAASYAISIEVEIDLKLKWKLNEIICVLFQQIVQESGIINDESVKCKSRTNILLCGFCWLLCEFRLFLCVFVVWFNLNSCANS